MKSVRRLLTSAGSTCHACLGVFGCLLLVGCAPGPAYTITDSPPTPIPYELKTKDVRKVLLIINHIALRNDRAKYETRLTRQKIEVTQGSRETVLAAHTQFPGAGPKLDIALTQRLTAIGRVVVKPPPTSAAADLSVPKNARKVAKKILADTVVIADIAQCAFTSQDRYYTSPGPRWSFVSLRREFAARVTIKIIDTKTGEPVLVRSLRYSVIASVVGERNRQRMKDEGLDIEKLMNWDAKVWPGVAGAFIGAFMPPVEAL